MSYHINFSHQAQNDIEFYKKTGNKKVIIFNKLPLKTFVEKFSFVRLIFSVQQIPRFKSLNKQSFFYTGALARCLNLFGVFFGFSI